MARHDCALPSEVQIREESTGAIVTQHMSREDCFERGHSTVARLVAETGGLWSAAEAAERLRIVPATLSLWRDQRRVLALSIDGTEGYPAAQFTPPAVEGGQTPRPLPGLAAVLQATANRLTPTELFVLLSAPQPILGGRTGWAALTSHDPDTEGQLVHLLAHAATPADSSAPPA